MDLSISLPLDQDGFLRRECPSCDQQFKWHYGPANEEAENESAAYVYYCPFCGEPAGMDSWWTREQAAYVEGAATTDVMRQLQQEFRAGSRSSSRRSGLRLEFKGGDIPAVPGSLTEPVDMQIIASPCHSYEPVKVPDDATGPFHCLICGQQFAV